MPQSVELIYTLSRRLGSDALPVGKYQMSCGEQEWRNELKLAAAGHLRKADPVSSFQDEKHLVGHERVKQQKIQIICQHVGYSENLNPRGA